MKRFATKANGWASEALQKTFSKENERHEKFRNSSSACSLPIAQNHTLPSRHTRHVTARPLPIPPRQETVAGQPSHRRRGTAGPRDLPVDLQQIEGKDF